MQQEYSKPKDTSNRKRCWQDRLFYCKICTLQCAGPLDYQNHITTRNHKEGEFNSQQDNHNTNPSSHKARDESYQYHKPIIKSDQSGQAKKTKKGEGEDKLKLLEPNSTIKTGENESNKVATAKIIKQSQPNFIKKTDESGDKKVESAQTLKESKPSLIIEADNSRNTKSASDKNETKMSSQPNLTKSAGKSRNKKVDNIDQSSASQNLGQEYLKSKLTSKGGAYCYCDLCECMVPNNNNNKSKSEHLEGKRHRELYKMAKMKAPSLDVQLSSANNNLHRDNETELQFQTEKEQKTTKDEQIIQDRYNEDDKHVMAKHSSLYPSVQDMKVIESILGDTERALKLVAVELKEAHTKIMEAKQSSSQKSNKQTVNEDDCRVLIGVVRVGDVAKGLLLKGDLKAELVVLCNDKPTFSVFVSVAEKLSKHFESCKLKYEVKKDVRNAVVIVASADEPKAQVTLALTSHVIRSEAGTDAANPHDMLNKTRCLQALASHRRTTWYKGCAAKLKTCPMIIRILKDFCRRIQPWTPLESWTLELLVEKVISSLGRSVSPGESLRYVFEALASGILLPDGPGILDPCENEPVDASERMTKQEKEGITASAQHALRMLSFAQIHQVLNMNKLQCDDALTNQLQ